ncbi:MAG TPA: MetQ/NlpA family ABC transporter substrate-binding protein [Actinomycetaceae bacterium]|nr:MetQ/NlpA family ABC transporter substrate-binding protein [Actinomycetaceae bacterium]
MRTTRVLPLAAAVAALSLALAGCGGNGDDGGTTDGGTATTPAGDAQTDATGEADGETLTISVGATPVPHAQILTWISDNIAADAGLEIEIVEFTDYPFGNRALSEGEFDANYFQHLPYFDEQVAEFGYDIQASVGIHIEPYGVYSETITDIADLPEGGTISVPNDPSNQARALWLLEDAGVFTLNDSVDNPTIYDVDDNPKGIQLTELDAAQLATTLQDVDASVINGNYALDAGLVPSEDAIVLESGEDNPYANVVAYRSEDVDSEAIAALIELLTSEDVRAYIEQTWPNGEVIPAF